MRSKSLPMAGRTRLPVGVIRCYTLLWHDGHRWWRHPEIVSKQNIQELINETRRIDGRLRFRKVRLGCRSFQPMSVLDHALLKHLAS